MRVFCEISDKKEISSFIIHAHEQVIEQVKEGNPPIPPKDCPAHDLMTQCWHHNPKKRPAFDDCRKQIEQLLTNEN